MKKKNVLLIFVAVLFTVLAVISCGKKNPAGPLSICKIKLTETPTCTPNLSYQVYIHQESTPAVGVGLSLHSADTGENITGTTGTEGTAYFGVHNGGKWNLSVDSFNGFDSQIFSVEPVSNTLCAINYGIPSLDIKLVSGSESIPIWATTVTYVLTYHTKFQRLENIENLAVNITFTAEPQSVRKEGDTSTCTFNIPNSFEGYNDSDKYLKFNLSGLSTANNRIYSNDLTWTKNWYLKTIVNFDYKQVWDYCDNNGHVSYYGGIVFTTKPVLISPGYSTSQIFYEIVNAENTGSDGSGTYENAGTCMPDYTDAECYNVLLKIPTNSGLDNNFKNDNNGSVTIRFYDNIYLNVKRIVKTNNNWNANICARWCCTSRDVSRSNYTCRDNMTMPCDSCRAAWDRFRAADLYRDRFATLDLTK
jgi:hypothetical protein